jgi:hypothetical protein
MSDLLGTTANILQLITSITFFVAAYKWGRPLLEKHPIRHTLLLVFLGVSILVGGLSAATQLGLLPAQKPIQVFSRHFKNEDVVLDNHEYFDCIFEDVNIVYAGGYFRVERPKWIGPQQRFTANSSPLSNAVSVMLMMGLLDASKIRDVRSGPLH